MTTQTEIKGRVTMPTKRLTDPSFRYTPACATDVRKTIQAARDEIKRKQRMLPVVVYERG